MTESVVYLLTLFVCVCVALDEVDEVDVLDVLVCLMPMFALETEVFSHFVDAALHLFLHLNLSFCSLCSNL